MLRIVSVSHDEQLLQLRTQLLTGAGHAVAWATSVSDAERLMQSAEFDVLLIGHTLKTVDRVLLIRLAKQLRKSTIELYALEHAPTLQAHYSVDALRPEELLKALESLGRAFRRDETQGQAGAK